PSPGARGDSGGTMTINPPTSEATNAPHGTSLRREPLSAKARKKAAKSAARQQRTARQDELRAQRRENRATRGTRPGPRGFSGAGGGRVSYVEAPPEWRGTTVQVCGLWPFSAGSGTPMVGVPVGRELS